MIPRCSALIRKSRFLSKQERGGRSESANALRRRSCLFLLDGSGSASGRSGRGDGAVQPAVQPAARLSVRTGQRPKCSCDRDLGETVAAPHASLNVAEDPPGGVSITRHMSRSISAGRDTRAARDTGGT